MNLKEQFEKETGKTPLDGSTIYRSSYISWLENKADVFEMKLNNANVDNKALLELSKELATLILEITQTNSQTSYTAQQSEVINKAKEIKRIL